MTQNKTRGGSEAGTPATLSKPILTGILRKELHFQGLIITDAMDMKAITDNFDLNFAVEHALSAGADIILMPVKCGMKKQLSALIIYIAIWMNRHRKTGTAATY